MRRGKLIKKVEMDCPVCGKVHEVEERSALVTDMFHGKEIAYEEIFFFCENASEDYSEFQNGTMVNKNLDRIKKAYKEKCEETN